MDNKITIHKQTTNQIKTHHKLPQTKANNISNYHAKHQHTILI